MKRLQEIIKIGEVSSVDIKQRTARVIFKDKDDMVSGNLQVLINHPLLTISKSEDEGKWNSAGAYNSAPRNLGNDSYKKTLPDTIDLDKVIRYETESKNHKMHVEVHPWLPYVGQMVACIFLPTGDGDGFIMGGF